MSLLQYVKKVHIESLGDLPIKEGGGSFQSSHYKRDYVSGTSDKAGGYMEKYQPAKLVVELNMTKGLSIQELLKFKERSIIISLSTDNRFMMTNAWFQEATPLKGGGMTVTFCSQESSQI